MFQLKQQQKTAIMIHTSLTITVTRNVKYYLLKTMRSELLEQKLQLITKFIQLAEKLLFHMHVINMLSQFFFMH